MDERKIILADICPFETRVALLENGMLAEYYVELPGHDHLAGNIYKGVVRDICPGMDAAFVDIGLEKNAFLYCGEIGVNSSDFSFGNDNNETCVCPVRNTIHKGQTLMVQVLKEPMGTKGARITTNITLPGRLLVLMPLMGYVGVSRRIEDEEERLRLRAIATALCPKGVGIIMRTAAEGATEEAIGKELNTLLAWWEEIVRNNKRPGVPSLLYSDESLMTRCLRDMADNTLEKVIVNDAVQAEIVKRYLAINAPESNAVVECYPGDYSLFDRFAITSDINRSYMRKVWLKSGGYLIFDHTEALCAIDVNTGRYVGKGDPQDTILNANIEACKEIARQIRLRDIGGIIVIDFIDMASKENREALLDAFKEALKPDRSRAHVHDMTLLGLVEVTRKKVRTRIHYMVNDECPYCSGSGMIYSPQAVSILSYRKYKQFEDLYPDKNFTLTVHREVAEFMQKNDMLREMPRVEILSEDNVHRDSINLNVKE